MNFVDKDGTTKCTYLDGSFHFLSVHPTWKKKSEGHANEYKMDMEEKI